MTREQPLALRLADELDDDPMGYGQHAAELRRLHAENEALRGELKMAVRQNEHDMLMTGEELRACEAAIFKATNHET
jgi:hypothetical protein